MPIGARYVHTNIVARDWLALARFYQEVLGCEPLQPERDLAGPGIERATGIRDAHLRGIHLRLPGHGAGGPTLEIFEYDRPAESGAKTLNRPGLTHTAFLVEDVSSARDAVIAAGGGTVGEMVSLEISGAGRVTFLYAHDPEGNIVELQSWA